MNQKNREVLLTISGIKFHQNEGAKKRLDNFIDSYNQHNYKVTVLLFFSFASLRYIFSYKKYLNPNASWILLPHIPVGKNKLLASLSIFYNQVVIGIFDRTGRYKITQSEVLGDTGRFIKNSIFVTDFHGDSVSEAEYLYGKKNDWLPLSLKKRQIDSILNSDHLICVSKNLHNHLKSMTDLPLPFSIISCSVDTEKFKNSPSIELIPPQDKRFILGYLGGLQKWQNIDAILNIFSRLLELDPCYYLQIYSNDDTQPIEKKLKALGKNNYGIKSLTFSEVPSYVKALDAGLLIREKNDLNIYSSPTKIGEYLASGVPLICTKYSGDYAQSVNHKLEGFILQDVDVPDSELHELHNYLQKLLRNREFYRQACIKAACLKSWKNEFDNYIAAIEKA